MMLAPLSLWLGVAAFGFSPDASPQAGKKVAATHYAFDSLHRLRSIRRENGSTSWIARDLGGRVAGETRTNLADGIQSSHAHSNDGWRRIATNGASGEKRFLYGRYLDELLLQESIGKEHSPVVSQLGSTMKWLDSTGSVVDQFRYDAYGTPLAGDAKSFSHLFAGAIYDFKSKLYDLRHRHYDPKLGRFLSRDPLGMHADAFNAGNAYSYVGNNPLNRRDPLGLLTGDPYWEGFWKGLKQGIQQGLADAGQGLVDSAKGTWDSAKFLATEEIPNLIVDAGIAIGAIDKIPYQSETVQTAQDYYADAENSVLGAVADFGKDLALGAATAVKDYGIAVWEGDSRATAKALGYALQGFGAAKASKLMRAAKSKSRAGSEGPGNAKCPEPAPVSRRHRSFYRDGSNSSGSFREISVIYEGDFKYVRIRAFASQNPRYSSIEIFCEGTKTAGHEFPVEFTGETLGRLLHEHGIVPSDVSILMSSRSPIVSDAFLDAFFEGLSKEVNGSLAGTTKTIISPHKARMNDQWFEGAFGAPDRGIEYPDWVLTGDCQLIYFDE